MNPLQFQPSSFPLPPLCSSHPCEDTIKNKNTVANASLAGSPQEDQLKIGNQPDFRSEHIERFQRLYQQHFGVWVNEVEAQRLLTALVVLVRYRHFRDRNALPADASTR